MTYCVGMLLDAGLVCLSDSRTNAGVDHISTFRKMNIFEREGERVLVIMTSGNLAISQTVVSILHEEIAASEPCPSIYSLPNMFEVARHIGETIREVHRRDAKAFDAFGLEFNTSLILAGQIRGEAPRLFNIYAAGNFIEATPDTRYFQIGEAKYGKPIIDRILTHCTPLDEAAKCALISMDSTLRSNLSVGLPLDLVVVHTDSLKVNVHQNITAEDAYFTNIRKAWGASLRQAFNELPNPQGL